MSDAANKITSSEPLVKAAVEATCVHTGKLEICFCEKRVRKTLAAAFAALPECEAVDPGRDYPESCRDGWNDCLEAIAALAREFGDPT